MSRLDRSTPSGCVAAEVSPKALVTSGNLATAPSVHPQPYNQLP